jgi:hypothetical protein|tara:strand:+ start:2242 stop:4017 length:1776 start_codon:yes stop_codon:yes gene_type:complete
MNRQLRADGGIMQVAPREKFGLGSKLKKFVRKIIPNEISEIAVTAAPFVAPFNPLLAAGMSGLGSFDQTGRIGDSLKKGALTYGLGQGARYLGGADFQGLQNPFAKDAFSMPTGSGGIKNLFKDKVQPVEGVGESTFFEDTTVDALPGDIITTVDKTTVSNVPGSAMDSFNTIKSFNTSPADKGKAALDLLRRGSKTLFYDSKGNLDKAAVLGAATFALSYAEAKALAAQAGIDLTEEEYDQAQRDEKKEEYAGYLQNFFGGKKDGGRIGYADGPRTTRVGNLEIVVMPGSSQEKAVVDGLMNDIDGIVDEDTKMNFYRTLIPELIYSGEIDSQEGMKLLQELGINMKADGGRIGYSKGSEPEEAEIGIMSIDVKAGDDEDEEDMMMAGGGITFTSAEKSYLFRRLGGAGGPDRSFTMPQLYGILKNPNSPANIDDAKVLKQIAIMGLEGRKDGGRIGYKDGSKGANRVSELLITRAGILAQDPDADVSDIEAEIFQLTGKTFRSVGGISDIPTGKIRKNNAGVVERDYRDEGGFVPVGIKERADDVPAMLSKNEFVMTADAVRGIGNGSVEEGSRKLYNTMKKAEKVGKA